MLLWIRWQYISFTLSIYVNWKSKSKSFCHIFIWTPSLFVIMALFARLPTALRVMKMKHQICPYFLFFMFTNHFLFISKGVTVSDFSLHSFSLLVNHVYVTHNSKLLYIKQNPGICLSAVCLTVQIGLWGMSSWPGEPSWLTLSKAWLMINGKLNFSTWRCTHINRQAAMMNAEAPRYAYRSLMKALYSIVQ